MSSRPANSLCGEYPDCVRIEILQIPQYYIKYAGANSCCLAAIPGL